MKILFLTSGSIRSNFTYRAFALARELRKKNHRVAIISPKADKYNNFISERIDSIDGVKILQPFQFLTKRIEINLFPYILSAIYIVLRENPDLVYIYKPTPISIVGFLAKIFGKAVVVLDMDDLGSEVMKIEKHPWHQQKLVEWCERLSARFADRIVVASSFLFDMYRKQYPVKPLHLMSNGIDNDWVEAPIVSVGNSRIVFMGSLNRCNILEPLFDVFPNILKRYPNARLLIIGDGKYLQYFKNKSNELRISDSVKFTGWLSIDKARENLQYGDIGYNYMPDENTIKAASNMKVPQYMVRGVVPLVSCVGDLPSMVAYGKAGYVCNANDRSALEKELLEIMENKDGNIIKAKVAREFAIEKFDWAKLANDFEAWLGVKKILKINNKQKIYFVATNFPSDTGGAEIRNLNLIKQLNARNNTISLFCITKNINERIIQETELNLGIKIFSFQKQSNSIFLKICAILKRMQPFMIEYRMSGLGDKFRSVCENELPDVVQIEQIDAYYCIQEHIQWLQKQGVKIILDEHNVESTAFRGAIKTFSSLKQLSGMCLLPTLERLEIEALKRCNIIFGCSVQDVEYFKKFSNKVHIVPNGVDCEQFAPSYKKGEPYVIFIGGVKYSPNADALKFYLKDIHSKVKEVVPKVQLLTIGATKKWLDENEINDDSVIPLGFVDNVKPYLDKAILGICPIRQGSGTRLKVLTYMAAGLPIVATSKGAEGISYTNGQNIAIANSADQFVKKLIYLLNNKSSREFMGNNARKLALKLYDWNVIGKGLNMIYQKYK